MGALPRPAALALACALALAAPASHAAPDEAAFREARSLLERMNSALARRNYIGTLRHQRGDRAETLRIMHRVRGNDALRQLDGSDRRRSWLPRSSSSPPVGT